MVACAVWAADVAIFSDAGANFAGTARSGESVTLILGYAALGCVPLLWRRAAPLLSYGLVWLVTTGSVLVPGYQAILALLVALSTVAARRRIAWAVPALLLALLSIAIALQDEAGSGTPDRRSAAFLGGLAIYGLVYGSGFAVGRWAFLGRARAEQAERRRLVAAREAVADERLRISRELHDIVSHAVTVMMLQAGGALRVLRDDADRAEQALGHVRDAGAQAMNELRRMLVVLRRTEPENGDGARQPTLADLETLLASVSRAGLAARLRTRGEPRPVDPSVASTAYRVVQEALTNVVRHAGTGVEATVDLVWAGGLEIRVSNTAGRPADAAKGAGHGLTGLRERVGIVGGTFAAARTPDGGFAVTVALPAGVPASHRAPAAT